MTIAILTPPSDKPVTVERMKEHLRVDTIDDDDMIADMLDAVTVHVAQVYGRALGRQTIRWTVEESCSRSAILLPLPVRPVVSITSIRYMVGTTFTDYASTDFSLFQRDNDSRSFLRFVSPADARDVVDVTYVAGEANVPWDLKHAIKMMVARLYEHRGEMVDVKMVEDRAIASLLSPYRPMVV